MVADKVRDLAVLNKARVTIVHLVQENFIEHFGKVFSSRLKELTDLARQHQQEDLDQFLADDRWAGINISGTLLQGKAFIAIIQKILKDQHDLVIKGRDPVAEIDQLAMRLFRKCPCPVWIISDSPTGDFKNILAAVDVGAQLEETKRLNEKIIELSSSLAQREQGTVYYLHAWRLENETTMRGPRLNMSAAEISEIKKELFQARKASMVDLLQGKQIQITPTNLHLVEGEISNVVHRALEDFNIDVLVMGTIGRSGVPGLLIGNKAEEILTKINCTVLAVKPDGYTSPVTL